MLKAEHLTVHYGEKEAVKDLSFELREGEWLVLVGPNGAGKSSLAGALGRSVPWEGNVTLQGKDIRSFKAQEYARKVGVLSQQHSAVYGFTVEEVVGLGRYARRQGFFRGGDPEGAEMIAKALAETGLAEMRGRNMLTLSGGEMQRVFLAQVFAQDPEILILDEPANHLDLPFQQELFTQIGRWLETPGRAAVTVMHDLSLARMFGTHALLMDRGQCVCRGTVGEVLTRENLQAVYHMDVYEWMQKMFAQWSEDMI